MNLSSPPGSHNPQRLPFKFLTRNLQTSISPKIVFRNAYVKRFFVKNLHQREDYYDETKDFISKLIKTKSCCKTLKSISLLSVSQPSLQNNLKLCKNLKKFHLATERGYMKMKKVTIILRKLSRNLQIIYLKRVVPNPETDETFYKFAKTIFRFPKLKIFDRDFGSFGNFHSIQSFHKELKVYSQFASRLKQIKTVNFGFSLFEMFQFQGAMKEKFVYAGINGLIMNLQLDCLFKKIGLEVFDSENHHLYSDIPYDLNDQEHISQILSTNRSEEKINQELMMKKRMREEIELFFSFELFPNLKRLEINQDTCFCTLNSFVGHGFKYLKKLQELSIVFPYRSDKNLMYFCKQLFHLPLLKKLSLNLPRLKNEEWVFLEQFLKGQEKLESFRLCLPGLLIPFYPEQNIYLENTIKSLSNKPLLNSLELESPSWPLKTISRGFSWLKMENQLHTLKIIGNEIVAGSDKELVKGVEALCSFINSQKDSLKIIYICVPFVVQSQILNPIFEAISGLKQLRELEIFVGYNHSCEIKYLFDGLRQIIEKDIFQKKFNISQTWASDLAKNLLRIKNLESFIFGFDILNHFYESQELLEGFLDIMDTLPRLERLREVQIASRALLPLQQQIANSVLQLENIREITFYFHDERWGDSSCFDDLKKVVEYLNKKQSIRSDLMF